MKKLVKLISLIICLSLLVGSVFSFSAAGTGSVGYITTNVNVRTAPGTWNASLGIIGPQYVTVYGTAYDTDGDMWYYVSTPVGDGYVYERYVTIIQQSYDEDFEQNLLNFPESYREKLRMLHSMHPSWKFVADNLSITFSEAVEAEYGSIRKYVELGQGAAWRSMQSGAYNWDSGQWKIYDSNRWVAASKEVVEYYMDPRNFLDSTYVYMFMQQSYDPAHQNAEGLATVVANSFLAGTYNCNTSDPVDSLYGGSYQAVIMAAAQQSKVSPYVIAAKIITEVGRNNPSSIVSGTVSGYEGYYNFFNWGAYGTDPVKSGLDRAKQEGWDSVADAIIGGANKLADGYVDSGQDTYYYMDYNVSQLAFWHQYAASAYDAYVKAYQLARVYAGSYDNSPLVFKIPVFKGEMPSSTSKAEKGDERLNNYYLTALTATGLTPEFSMYTQSYSLSVTGDTTVYVKTPEGASVVSSAVQDLSAGANTVNITVQAQSGFTNTYTITVNALSNCRLTVSTGDPSSGGGELPSARKKGDTNGDGRISIVDLANVQKHLLDRKSVV